MLAQLLRLVTGQVRIQVRGAAIEKFLNRCMRDGIALHDTQHVDLDELHTTISIYDFRRLRTSVRRIGCRVHILHRHGTPFLVRRLRRRYVLLAGTLLIGMLFLALTQFVWVVQITAQPGISTYELRESLRRAGAYAGVPICRVDETAIRDEVRSQMTETIDYLTVSRTGNLIFVEAFGGKARPQMQDDKAETGIVAVRDGQIVEMQVLGGYALVQKGDIVTQGQKLVTAATPPTTEQGIGHIGHGQARILAETRHILTAVQPLTRQQKHYTGKRCVQFALVLGEKRFNLYCGSSAAGKACDKYIRTQRLKIGENTVFPVVLVRQEYRYYNTKPQATPQDTLQKNMEQSLQNRIQKQMQNGQINDWHSDIKIQNDALFVTLHANCTEDIAVEVAEEIGDREIER